MSQGVGLAFILFPYLLGLSGFQLFFNRSLHRLASFWGWGIAHILWLSIAFGYFFPSQPLYSGIIGYEINLFLTTYIGRIGIFTGLTFFFLCFLVLELGWTPEKMKTWWNRVMVQTKNSNTPGEKQDLEPRSSKEHSTETPNEAEIDLSPTPSAHIVEPEETLSLKEN